MNLNELKIAIVGAGIGGLAAARALALRGADVRVLEQAPAIAEVGAGLQLSANGMAVIGALGLGERLAANGAPRVAGITLKNTVGRAVLRLDLGTHGAGEHLCVHRADLIDVLADGARAAGVKIGLLHAVSEVRGGASPCVTTRQGAQVAADLVIGADGLHSVVRPVLNGPAAPFFTGQVAWRATVPDTGTDVARAEVTLHMGPGCHLVTYPLRGGKLRNIVAVQGNPRLGR